MDQPHIRFELTVIVLCRLRPLPIIVGDFEPEPILQLVEACFYGLVDGLALAGRVRELVGLPIAAGFGAERSPPIEFLEQKRLNHRSGVGGRGKESINRASPRLAPGCISFSSIKDVHVVLVICPQQGVGGFDPAADEGV